MKKLYPFLLVAFFSLTSHSQIVDIPDPTFKNKLLNYPTPIDIDEDGEIQVSEALLVTELNFSFCNFNNITGIQSFANLQVLTFGSYTSVATPIDLTGLSALKSLHFTKCSFNTLNFEGLTDLQALSIGYGTNITFLNFEDTVNLKTVYFYSTHFTSVDISHAVNLTNFSAQNTDLTSITLGYLPNLVTFKCTTPGDLTALDLSGLTGLRYFEVEGANLDSINFEYNVLLKEIKCGGNSLSSISVAQLPELRELSCNSNHLTTLDVSNNSELKWLSCGENQLSVLDLTNLHKLEYVDASFNLFTSLDFSNLTSYDDDEDLPDYYINDNPNLTHVNLKNGKRDFVWMNNSLNCPNLTYLCLDEMDLFDQNQILQQNGITNIEINTYCTFQPGGNYNTITGTFSLDYDNNGCDASDYKFSNGKLAISNTNQSGITYTNTDGNYNFFTQTGDYTISPYLENQYFTISPATATVNFSNSSNNIEIQNFCLTPNGIHNDLEILLIPTQNARPGFDAKYRLVYKNKGNQILSGNINLTFNDAVLDFVEATPTVNSQAENQLNWTYDSLKPFEARSIDVVLNVNSSQEVPAVNDEDVLYFEAAIDPMADDETTADNRFTLPQTVSDSANSNDKICVEGDAITPEMVGDYVHYAIRFQNTGTAAATNIVVKDLINTDEFDLGSLQLVSASHPQVTKITANQVEFQFENINLPSENDDEAASYGYIAFKIKTKGNLVIDDTISNKADIYFDYNFPLETNTAFTIVSTLLSTDTFENTTVTIAPNPTRNTVHITSNSNITSIQLFDVQGRILATMLENQQQVDVDLSRKASGVYFVKIYTDKGVSVAKVIKE